MNPPVSRSRLWPALRTRPRLLGSLVFGGVLYVVLTRATALSGSAATLVAWDAGALLDLALALRVAWHSDADGIRRRAVTEGGGRMAILGVVAAGVLAVLLAVGTQLSQLRNLQGSERALHIVLAVFTIVTTWFFMQSVFALHYAHDFYLARVRGAPDPLAFPGTPDPLYGDFFHFACVIGATGQTADISFHGSALRGVGTAHCVIAFFFNASLLALSINVAAGVLT